MRITMTVNSTLDIESAIAALRHFVSEKKPNDGTSDVWGIGITGGTYFAVGVKPNGNYTVKQQD
ncbi:MULTISPECIES: hypothetical protein [Enterobacter cloacae complex]|uniref:hypothetical protein n=1 Tax=Enterobacter cloacae complex TaxID=354276 RepID=UPI0006511B6F|nr:MULTISPECIES: hypothetical protein [Enterobacter cloacae complex]EKV3711744.1 hypothetical protein [Enterobacter hormaechei]KLW40824.1 hypothetical protein SK53_02004 [Enterobacter sp. MGH119]MBQ0466438.1 hypothetical protein [Enterobacter hormaechei]MCC4548344.1 hypothetical protein [Enterobacter hormaechei]MCC4554830.1 hypothetical protein [Enterobacter hormaechei]